MLDSLGPLILARTGARRQQLREEEEAAKIVRKNRLCARGDFRARVFPDTGPLVAPRFLLL
ncbi:MAG: hypothetical protein WCF57_04540 [Pyrinomonadaceae bacterium]